MLKINDKTLVPWLMAIVVTILVFTIMPMVSAYDSHKQNEDYTLIISSNNATECNLTYINKEIGLILPLNKEGYDFEILIKGTNFTNISDICFGGVCTDSITFEPFSKCLSITPTGKSIDNVGQISVGILYFLIILAFGLIFLGYLFINKESIWLNYFGIFLMCLGFIFIYYDLHLNNLYAVTIAVDSGASNVTTNTFIMISRLLKIAPYLVVLIIAGVVIKLYNNHKKKKESNDGWDNNNY